ncbi:hypothetical protein L9F63_015583, partial [Diploptera punctata]
DVSEPPQPPPPPPTTAPSNTTTPTPTTSTTPTTTTSTTPTTPTTTTSTIKPNTTTTATTEHTTHSTTTDHPYPDPTTETTTPSHTTPAPTPSPKPPQKPEVGKWNVTDSNTTCIMVDMAIQLNISYIDKNNKNRSSIVFVPKDANATGSCGNETQVLDLEWKEDNKSFGNLSFIFSKNDTTKHFEISSITVAVIASNKTFPNITGNNSIELITKKAEFSTPVSKSYRCVKEQSFVLKTVNATNVTDSEITVSHVQLEAFNTKKDANFGTAEDCEPSSSTDIVPIAVGCALVGLVAIVLIAYLVGRRRSQARGYLSMPEEDPDS